MADKTRANRTNWVPGRPSGTDGASREGRRSGQCSANGDEDNHGATQDSKISNQAPAAWTMPAVYTAGCPNQGKQ